MAIYACERCNKDMYEENWYKELEGIYCKDCINYFMMCRLWDREPPGESGGLLPW